MVRWCWVNFQCRGVLQFGLVGQRPTALAVGVGGGGFDILLSSILSFLFLILWETARYRQKYCLKGPLNLKPTDQPTLIDLCITLNLNLDSNDTLKES